MSDSSATELCSAHTAHHNASANLCRSVFDRPWLSFEMLACIAVVIVYFGGSFWRLAQLSAKWAPHMNLSKGTEWFGGLLDLTDHQWRSFRKGLPIMMVAGERWHAPRATSSNARARAFARSLWHVPTIVQQWCKRAFPTLVDAYLALAANWPCVWQRAARLSPTCIDGTPSSSSQCFSPTGL